MGRCSRKSVLSAVFDLEPFVFLQYIFCNYTGFMVATSFLSPMIIVTHTCVIVAAWVALPLRLRLRRGLGQERAR